MGKNYFVLNIVSIRKTHVHCLWGCKIYANKCMNWKLLIEWSWSLAQCECCLDGQSSLDMIIMIFTGAGQSLLKFCSFSAVSSGARPGTSPAPGYLDCRLQGGEQFLSPPVRRKDWGRRYGNIYLYSLQWDYVGCLCLCLFVKMVYYLNLL